MWITIDPTYSEKNLNMIPNQRLQNNVAPQLNLFDSVRLDEYIQNNTYLAEEIFLMLNCFDIIEFTVKK